MVLFVELNGSPKGLLGRGKGPPSPQDNPQIEIETSAVRRK